MVLTVALHRTGRSRAGDGRYLVPPRSSSPPTPPGLPYARVALVALMYLCARLGPGRAAPPSAVGACALTPNWSSGAPSAVSWAHAGRARRIAREMPRARPPVLAHLGTPARCPTDRAGRRRQRGAAARPRWAMRSTSSATTRATAGGAARGGQRARDGERPRSDEPTQPGSPTSRRLVGEARSAGAGVVRPLSTGGRLHRRFMSGLPGRPGGLTTPSSTRPARALR